MINDIIPIAGPSISEKEISYVHDAVEKGWYEEANKYIDLFEEAFCKYLGRRFAISLPSCTSALHLSLLSMGIGKGDEVIVPDSTWIASVAPVVYAGATVIFADINPETWCLSYDTVKPLITCKTKAIISVNLYGQMPDYTELEELGIPIIEDAAESIGSKLNGRLSGTFGKTSCFSFHGSKTIVTGEGGMLVTDDEEIYNRCLVLRDHGRAQGDILFQNIEVGYKYKMSNLQAALGLAQLERVDELVEKKRIIFSIYNSLLEEANLQLNPSTNGLYSSYWMTTVVFPSKGLEEGKDKFYYINRLKEQKISARPFFSPLSSLAAFSGFKDSNRAAKNNTASNSISIRGVNLPSAALLSESDIHKVCEVVKSL